MAKSKSLEEETKFNYALTISIGTLVINWANNESVFLAMLKALLGGSKISAAIIWFSLTSTRLRLEIVSRLCKEQIKNKDLLKSIEDAMAKFKTATTTRNFYCHATYEIDINQILKSAHGHVFLKDNPEKAIGFVKKPLDKAHLNEIRGTISRLVGLNIILWDLLYALEDELGIPHVKRPPQFSSNPKST